jgi:hypothetical protein
MKLENHLFYFLKASNEGGNKIKENKLLLMSTEQLKIQFLFLINSVHDMRMLFSISNIHLVYMHTNMAQK